MGQRSFQFSLRGMLFATAVVAGVCALLARAPQVAAGIASFVAAASVLPYVAFDADRAAGSRSHRWLLAFLAIVGSLFLLWAGFELLNVPGKRGMAALAGVWGLILLSLAAALYWLGRQSK